MASATDFIDQTLANTAAGPAARAPFSPDIWSKNILVKQEANLIFAQHVNREYERDAKVGKAVIISTISDLGFRPKVENTAIQYETVAEAPIMLVLNIWDYAAFGIEDIVNVQSHINLRSAYEDKVAYALAKDVDSKLALGVGGYNNVFGVFGTPFTDDDLRDCVQKLDDNNVSAEGRVLIMTPAEKNDKLGLEKWVSVLYRGDSMPNGGGAQVNNGQIGRDIYGVTPYVSTNVSTGSPPVAGNGWNVVFHKDAYALVMQRQPKMHLFYDIDFFTWKVASEQILGHGELRDDHGVWLKGIS
jgi:hypothetical protein